MKRNNLPKRISGPKRAKPKFKPILIESANLAKYKSLYRQTARLQDSEQVYLMMGNYHSSVRERVNALYKEMDALWPKLTPEEKNAVNHYDPWKEVEELEE